MTRYFIGIATSRYPKHPRLEDRPELGRALADMRDLLTSDFGYQDVPGFGENLTFYQLRTRVRQFLTSPDRGGDDLVIFYYTGHGLADGGELYLPTVDTTDDEVGTAVWVTALAQWLLVDTRVKKILIILDTCHAATGAGAMARTAFNELDKLHRYAATPDVAVIAAARPREQALSCAFVDAFVAAARSPAMAGYEQEYFALRSIVSEADRRTPEWQHAHLFFSGTSTTEFLPNRRYGVGTLGLDLQSRRAEEQGAQRRAELLAHVVPRAQGLESSIDGRWLFTGRHAALRYLCRWLQDREPGRECLVVTGGPGSGKSSALARMFVLADAGLRKRVPRVDLLPSDTVPPVGSFSRFVHARGKTTQQVLAAVSEAVGVDASTVAELLDRARNRDDLKPVVIDAVDEAIDADDLVRSLLEPLLRNAAHAGLRLLVGTREHLLPRLPVPAIDLDDEAFADTEGVRTYARRCLTELVDDSPYGTCAPGLLDAVADAIGAAASRSFLVALITARSLALRGEVVRHPTEEWRRALPRAAAEAMERDIDERLGARAEQARELLLPLAYAQGAGIPWEHLWAPLAEALSGSPASNEDLDWLVKQAGYYIIENQADGRSGYRLFHESLAEHLRAGRDAASMHRRMVGALEASVPMVGGRREWSSAHPYLHRNLASHASMAGVVDRYLVDPYFLAMADPVRLLDAARTAASSEASRAAVAFEQAAYGARATSLGEFLSHLELAARQYDAAALLERLEPSRDRPWRTVFSWWQPPSPHRVTVRAARPIEHAHLMTAEDRTVVVAAVGAGFRVWDAATGVEVVAVDDAGAGRLIAISSAQVDEIDRLVCAGEAGLVVLDVASGQRLSRWRAEGITCMAAGRHAGRPIAIVAVEVRRADRYGIDGCLMKVDLRTGKAVGELWARHETPFAHLWLGPNGGDPVVATVDDAGAVCLWELANGRVLRQWPTFRYPGAATWFVIDGKARLAVVGGEGTMNELRLWDADGLEQTGPRVRVDEDVTACAVTQMDGMLLLLTGDGDGVIRIRAAFGQPLVWSGDPVPVATLTGHEGPIAWMHVAQTGDGTAEIYTGGEDGTVRVWNLNTGALARDLRRDENRLVSAVRLHSRDAGWLLVAGGGYGAHGAGERGLRLGGHVLRRWLLHRGGTTPDLPADTEPLWRTRGEEVNGLEIVEADGRTYAVTAGGADCRLRVKALDGSLLTEWIAHDHAVTALAVAADGARTAIVSGGADGTVKVWDPFDGALLGLLRRYRGDAVHGLCIARHRGRAIAVIGTQRGRVEVVDLANGRTVQRWRVAGPVGPVGFIPGAATIVFGCHDRLSWINLSDPAPRAARRSRQAGGTIVAHVQALAVDPGGERCAFGVDDRIVSIDLWSGRVTTMPVWSRIRSVAVDAAAVAVAAVDGVVVFEVPSRGPATVEEAGWSDLATRLSAGRGKPESATAVAVTFALRSDRVRGTPRGTRDDLQAIEADDPRRAVDLVRARGLWRTGLLAVSLLVALVVLPVSLWLTGTATAEVVAELVLLLWQRGGGG
jgi:WD40 repeat protein